jgi:hypothetical protein
VSSLRFVPFPSCRCSTCVHSPRPLPPPAFPPRLLAARTLQVHKFNGEPVRNLRQLAEMVVACKETHMRFDVDFSVGGRGCSVRRAEFGLVHAAPGLCLCRPCLC